MKTFFINFDKFDFQVEDTLDSIIKGYEAMLAIDNKIILNYNWTLEKEKIRRFPKKLKDLVEVAVLDENGEYRKDIFGNEFKRGTYKYVQISSIGTDTFASIRFLGETVLDKKETRYYIKNLKHNFEPTTLNFVQNLQEIIQPNCNLVQKTVDKNFVNSNYSWEKISTKVFSPPAKAGPILDVSLFTDAFLKDTNDSLKKDSFTTDELNKRNKEQQNFIAMLYGYSTDRTESNKGALSQLSEENQDRAEEFRQTLDRIGNLPSRFNAADLVADALQCLIPGSCEEFIRKLPVNKTLEMIKAALPKDCPTYKEVELAVDNVLIGNVKIYKENIENIDLLIEEQRVRVEEIEQTLITQDEIMTLNESLSEEFDVEKILSIISEKYDEVDAVVSDDNKREELIDKRENIISIINSLTPNTPLYVENLEKIKQNYKEWYQLYSEEISGFAVYEQLKFNLEGNRTLKQDLEKKIETEIDLKLKELNLSERQIALFDRKALNMQEVYSNIQAFNQQEYENFNLIKNRIYDAIEDIIPLSGLCGAFGDIMNDIFDIFSKFPEPRELNDIFAGLSEEIILILLKLIAEIILLALETIINTLLNCANIDAIVAMVLGEASPGGFPDLGQAVAGAAQNFTNAFVGELLSELSEIDVVESIVDIWSNTAEPAFWAGYYEALKIDELVQQKIENQETDKEFVLDGSVKFDFEAVYKYLETFSSWKLDPEGNDFIIESAGKIVKLRDFDLAMAKSSTDAINIIPAGVINEGLFRSLKSGQNVELTKFEQTDAKSFFPSPQVMKDELGQAIFSTTAVATPSEIINALAGDMSDETADLAAEIMRNRAPNLSNLYGISDPNSGNNNNVKQLFANLGRESGLNKLLPQLQLLSALPEVQNRLVANKLCDPYDNVDDFRKALMKRIVPEKEANEIIDNINNEKINKYSELTDTLIGLGQGLAPDAIKANPAQKLLQDLNDKLFNPLKAAQEESLKDKKDPRSEDLKKFADSGKPIADYMRDRMNERAENDPIYQSMLNTTIDSVISPIKDAFDSAMDGFLDANAEEKEVEVLLKRLKKVKTKSGREVMTLNPKYRQYINNGMVPIIKDKENGSKESEYKKEIDGKIVKYAQFVNKDSLELYETSLDDLRVAGHPGSDFTKRGFLFKRLFKELEEAGGQVLDNVVSFFTGGEQEEIDVGFGFEPDDYRKRPILIKEKKKTLGTNFSDGLFDLIKIENGNSKLKSYFGEGPKDGIIIEFDKFESPNSEIKNLIKRVEIGKVDKNSGIKGLSEQLEKTTGLKMDKLKKEVPTWGLKLSEKGQTTTINVDVNGSSISRSKGKVKFSEKYDQTYEKILVDENTKESLNLLFPDSEKTRKEAFYELIKNNYKNIDGESSADSRKGSLEIQNKMFDNIKNSVLNFLGNSRIFQKTSIGILPEDSDDLDEQQYLYFIQLFNFTRRPTKEEQERGFDPNIMGFEGMNNRFMKIYNNEPEVEEGRKDGKTKVRNRFTNSCYKMILEIVVKLAVVEFCLKTLPTLEGLKFSKSMTKNDFLKDFLKSKVRESIKTMGIDRVFKREMRKVLKPGESYSEAFEKSVLFNFEEALDHFAKIFHICDKDRNLDSIRKELLDSIEIVDVHDRDSNNESKFLKQVTTRGEIKKTPSTAAKSLANVLSQKLSFLKDDENNKSAFSTFSKKDKLNKALKEISKIKKDNSAFKDLTLKNMWVEKRDPDKVEVQEKYKKGDFVLERYIKFGKVNNQQFKSKFEDRVMSIEKARKELSGIITSQKLYDCENPEEGIFKNAPRFGLRMVYISDVSTNSSSKHVIKNKSYAVKQDRNNLLKLKEKTGGSVKYYNLFELYSSELPLATNNLTIQEMTSGPSALLNMDNFNTYFYPILRKQMYTSDHSKVLFDYCFGMKELISVGVIHNYFLSNNENMKFLLESMGERIKQTLKVLDNFGDKTQTNATLAAMREDTRKNMENEGNPAGPIGPFAAELLKIFIRTPIHILRGLATIVDPNIFISNLIVAGVSIGGALLGKKLWVPYTLTSILLFPAPLFVPPYMIPLTAYNIGLPIGPIFLALEWLLWDLPWYKAAFAESELTIQALKDYGIDNTGGQGLNDPDCEDDLEDEILGPEYDNFVDGEPSTPFLDYLVDKIKEECGDK